MDLLHQIETYLESSHTAPTTFGRLAVDDPRFVIDLRAGRTPRRKTRERVAQYLQEQGATQSSG